MASARIPDEVFAASATLARELHSHQATVLVCEGEEVSADLVESLAVLVSEVETELTLGLLGAKKEP